MIPYDNKEPGSHITIINFNVLDGFTLLNVIEYDGHVTFSVALPVSIEFMYDDGEVDKQLSYMYMDVVLQTIGFLKKIKNRL